MTAISETRIVFGVRDRWCYKCGDYVTSEGYHWPDGSFNEYSVYISVWELRRAMNASGRSNAPDAIARTRYAIAFGKHIGTYQR